MATSSSQPRDIVLASSSTVRQHMLRAAGLAVSAMSARVDEEAVRLSMTTGGASPRDIADALADAKARKIANRYPESIVIGCDQVLDFVGEAWAKAETVDAARAQLHRLRGQTHLLHSAAVIYDGGIPVWRHVGKARMTMRMFSDAFLEDYLARNWDTARDSVGTYRIEEEGIRLFSLIEGDHFTVLGLPLLPVLNYFSDHGIISS